VERVRLFLKVLIANRGEIAVRIARACKALGIRSVGVYSDADQTALHARVCDEAYHIGPSPASESYLRSDKLLDVARNSGCEAVHPGYGFLAENSAFAQKVIDTGLAWIGPPPAAIALMGSKIESKRLAVANGVPIVPGYFEDDQALGTLRAEAERIGYPVLIKASAGGGGKGMRIVDAPAEFEAAFDGARREALAAFGDESVMLEKYLSRPRHIEVQVLGDHHGKMLHLGERECSIQRRHQKVAEESPSPAISEETRFRMTSAALALARAAGYQNAGTVEFIYEDGDFYFLEMNTRLQVEHPVTEEALGLDVVQMQIRIAAGEPLALEQHDVRAHRHALEVRLYAEDPQRGFLPSTGTLNQLRLPDGLPGVRVDAGIEQGDAVTPFYDPMIAKIITSGGTRRDSITRMQEALGYTAVGGVNTNLDFLRWLVAQPKFADGDFSTRFIEEEYVPGAYASVPTEAIVAAAIALLTNLGTRPEPGNVWHSGAWRQAQQGMPISLEIEGRTYDVQLSRLAGVKGKWDARVLDWEEVLYEGPAIISGPRSSDATVVQGVGESSLHVQLGDSGTAYNVQTRPPANGDLWTLELAGRKWWFRHAPALSTETLVTALHLKDEDNLESPMPGKVLKLMVQPGDTVTDGQPLVIIEAMKMEFTVKAHHEGRVETVRYKVGDQVAVGDILVELAKRVE
jgi:3-methylcrotonyl-CoA carboxylase alpha subunit